MSTAALPPPSSDGRPAPALPRVSVVVPVRSGGRSFARCLDALEHLEHPAHELVVVVDGTDEASDPLDALRAERAGAVVVRLAQRGGPGRARNEGCRVATGDVLLFVDADVAVAPDVVRRVAEHLAAHPEVDAVFGAYDDVPAEPGFTSQYKNLVNHLVHTAASREGSTFWAGCGAVRRDAFAALGGFDERYDRPCVEDIELGRRLVTAGRRVHVLHDVRATHLKQWTPRGLVRTDVLQRAVPWSTMILRNGDLPDTLDVAPRHRVQVALAPAAVLLLLAGAVGRSPRASGAGAAAATAVVALDAPLLGGLARLRGPAFAARATPWRLTTYLYSAASLTAAAGLVAAEKAGLRARPRARLRADLLERPLGPSPRRL